MGLIAFPLPALWTLGTGLEAFDTHHIRMTLVGAGFSDTFDSAVNYATGGDGAKANGWNLLNVADCDSIDAHTTNAGNLTIDCNANASAPWNAAFTGTFLYRNVLGDFDLETYVDHNGDANYEMGGIYARDPAATAGEDWVSVLAGYDGYLQTESQKTDNSSSLSSGSAHHKYLRMVRTGNNFYLYSKSLVGDAWTGLAARTPAATFATSIQVGILTRPTNTSNTLVVKFPYFTFNSGGGAYSTLSPEAESPWMPCPYTTLDATTPIAIRENHLDGTGSVKYKYAINNGAYNASWETLAQMNAALAGATISDTTNSVRIKAQFISDGAQAADIMIASSIKASGLPAAGGGLLVTPGMSGGMRG